MFKNKRSAGFTLIELIIVVALIGIVVSIGKGAWDRYFANSPSNSSPIITHMNSSSNSFKCVNGQLIEKNGSSEVEVYDEHGKRVSCTPGAQTHY